MAQWREHWPMNQKKKEILPFVTAWMDLEIIMLSERQIPCNFSHMWNLMNKINKRNRNRLIETENRLTAVRGEGDGRAG